jgi:membrane protease YdiL (CAAX protease family)
MGTLAEVRKMRKETGLLEWDVWRAHSVMERKPDAATSAMSGEPDDVLGRVEPELAGEARRYRGVLYGALLTMFMPGILAILAWSAMYWLPVRIMWLPFERGGMGLPGLSLYEWSAFALLLAYLVYGLVQIRASHRATACLSADYRRLVAADESQRAEYAEAALSGRYPRVRAVLGKSTAFSMYEDLMRRPGATGDGAGEAGTESRLTSVRWDVGQVVGLFVVIVAIMITLSGTAAWIRESELAPTAKTLLIAAALFCVYLLEWAIAWGLARAASQPLAQAVGLRKFDAGKWVPAAIGAALVARIVAAAWSLVLRFAHAKAPGPGLDVTRLMPSGLLGVAMTVLMTAVLAPLVEEIIFRGIAYSALRDRFGDVLGAVFSAGMFAILHPNAYAIVPVFVLALMLSALFRRSGSLWVPVIAHMSFNALGLVGIYLLKVSGLT